MFNEFLAPELARIRQAQFLEDARLFRLLAEHSSDSPGLRERSLARIGDMLVLSGSALKARYALPLEGPPAGRRPCPEGVNGD